MLKDPNVDAGYVRRNENHKGRNCCRVPQQLIKSEIWIQLCTKCENDDLIQYVDELKSPNQFWS
jgi:hypothetical protein